MPHPPTTTTTINNQQPQLTTTYLSSRLASVDVEQSDIFAVEAACNAERSWGLNHSAVKEPFLSDTFPVTRLFGGRDRIHTGNGTVFTTH